MNVLDSEGSDPAGGAVLDAPPSRLGPQTALEATGPGYGLALDAPLTDAARCALDAGTILAPREAEPEAER